jgi:hypothetical protein
VAIGGVVINFKAVTDAAVREIRNLTRSLDDTDKSARDADKNHSTLGKTLKTGLAAGAVAAGAAIVGVGTAMISFAEGAIADNKAAENLSDTLKTIPGITDAMVESNAAWIDSMEIATGVADDDLRAAVSKLALSTGDLSKAQDLAALAADAAAGSGKKYSTVVTALDKAVNGNTSALERQFPWLDKNHDGTVTLTEAVDGLGDAYTGAAEKAQDRDPWERIKTIWGQIKEQLGQWVIPLIEKFGEWFKKPENKKALSDMITKIGDMATSLGEDLVPALEDFLAYLSSGKWKNTLGDTADDFRAVWRAVMLVVSAVAGLIGILQAAWRWLDKMNAKLQSFYSWIDRGITWPWERGRSASSSSRSAPSSVSTFGATATPRAYTGPVTINVTAANNPYETARTIKRALEGYDIGQGRKPWTPLAPAW